MRSCVIGRSRSIRFFVAKNTLCRNLTCHSVQRKIPPPTPDERQRYPERLTVNVTSSDPYSLILSDVCVDTLHKCNSTTVWCGWKAELGSRDPESLCPWPPSLDLSVQSHERLRGFAREKKKKMFCLLKNRDLIIKYQKRAKQKTKQKKTNKKKQYDLNLIFLFRYDYRSLKLIWQCSQIWPFLKIFNITITSFFYRCLKSTVAKNPPTLG